MRHPSVPSSTPSLSSLSSGLSLGGSSQVSPPHFVHTIDASTIREPLETLGHGAFGEVVRGTWGGTDVAIKKLLVSSASARELLERELMTHARIGNHPHIVELYGVYQDPTTGQLCAVLQLMQGGCMLDRLCANSKVLHRRPCDSRHTYHRDKAPFHTPECIAARPPLWKLVSFMKQIAAGVVHIHSKGLVHRDIACRNILVHGDGSAKVADFGLSRAVLRGAGGGGGGGSGSTAPVDPAYGVTDSSRGPVAWMAPEQMEAHVYSQKSDVFMFGVCMFEMVTYGAMPWAGLTAAAIIDRVLAGETLLTWLPRDTHDDLYSIMRSTWSRHPRQRPLMSEVLSRLQDLEAKLLQECPPSEPGAAPAPGGGGGGGGRYPRPRVWFPEPPPVELTDGNSWPIVSDTPTGAPSTLRSLGRRLVASLQQNPLGWLVAGSLIAALAIALGARDAMGGASSASASSSPGGSSGAPATGTGLSPGAHGAASGPAVPKPSSAAVSGAGGAPAPPAPAMTGVSGTLAPHGGAVAPTVSPVPVPAAVVVQGPEPQRLVTLRWFNKLFPPPF